MSNSNEITLNSYNLHAKEYLETTPQSIGDHEPEMKEWIDQTLLNTPQTGTIFEIGSAIPRDARYMQGHGYKVHCSDAAEEFVRQLNKESVDAIIFNILNDPFPRQYDTIFANGVFPHFTYQETRFAFQKIYNHLPSSGIFALSIKIGIGEEWILEKFNEKRFTHYWSRQEIFNLLHKCGFTVIFENSNDGILPSHHWLNLVCKKK